MYCKYCGNEINEDERYCPECRMEVSGNTEIKFPKIPRKSRGLIISVCIIAACIGIGLSVKGNSDDFPLLEQIENKYNIEVFGIEAAGGIAVDNVVLEDYLPYEGNQRYTTMVNSTDGTENVLEEMTTFIENGDNKYSVYSYLADFMVYGEMLLDDSEEYYYTQQENWWNTDNTDTDVYIGLPEKVWTKTNSDETTQIFIAPEFYTVTTPYGIYENCLLKYEHTSCDTDSWANSNTFTAYAPYGVGKVCSITYSEDSPETPLTYYTYIPEDAYSDLNNDGDSSAMELSPEIQNILDNSSHYVSDEGLILAFSNGTTDLWVINLYSNMINYHGTMGMQKYREGWPVTGDASMGCGDEILNFNDLEDGRRQAVLTLWGDIYCFTEKSTENNISDETDISQDIPDDGMMIADIMDDEASDLWISGNGTSALTLAMCLESEEMHVYLFSVHAMEILYSGIIGTATADEIYIIGDSEYGEGKIVYLSDSELELTVEGEATIFSSL